MKWLVYTCCCVMSMVNTSLPYAFGAMFVHMLDKYGESRAKTATVHATFLGIANISCVIGGWLVKRFGVPKVSFAGSLCVFAGFFVASFADSILVLNIAIGAIAGAGTTLVYMPSTVVVGRLFEKSTIKTALAFQMFTMGVGVMVYPYLLNAVSVEYGVSGAFLILSGILLNNILFAFVFYIHEKHFVVSNTHMPAPDISTNHHKESSTTPPANCGDATQSMGLNRVAPIVQPTYGGIRKTTEVVRVGNYTRRSNTADHRKTSDLTFLQRLRADFMPLANTQFILVTIAAGLVVCSLSGFLVVVMDLLAWKNISSVESLTCFTIYSIGSTASRGVFTLLSKTVPKYNGIIASIVCAVCGCVGQLLILFSHHVYFAFVGMAFTGISMGGTLCNAIITIASIVHQDLHALAIGLLMSVAGVLTLAIGPLYGYIRDDVRSYEGALIVTIAMLGVAAVLFSVVAVLRRSQTRWL